MAYEHVKEKFEAMGARAVVSVGTLTSNGRRGIDRRVNYTVDVNEDRDQGETFEVLVAPESADDVEITVPCIDKTARQLLLAIRNGDDYAQFLCGHDERHWFVAALRHGFPSCQTAVDRSPRSRSEHLLRGSRHLVWSKGRELWD